MLLNAKWRTKPPTKLTTCHMISPNSPSSYMISPNVKPQTQVIHLSWPPSWGELANVNIDSISTRTLASVSKEMSEAGHKVIPLSLEAALHRAGYDTVGKLVHSNPASVIQVRGVGPKRLLTIQDWRKEVVNYLLSNG